MSTRTTCDAVTGPGEGAAHLLDVVVGIVHQATTRAEASETFCDALERLDLSGGVALYDPDSETLRFLRGVLPSRTQEALREVLQRFGSDPSTLSFPRD